MTRTEKIDQVLQYVIEGENLDVMLNALSADDQNLFYDLVAELREGNDLKLEDLWSIDYIRRPPTMEEFIDDPYWLGDITKHADDNEGIYPAWREIICRDFNLDSRLHNVVITGSLGCGKCSPRGTCIIMYDGSTKAVENIVPGDKLMGDNSQVRTVLNTFTGYGKIYEIHPAKGVPFRVSENHILCLKSTTSDEVREVSVADFLKWPLKERHSACIYHTGVDWPEQEVPIDPYWLGLWLGDGTTVRPELTSADEPLATYFTDYGMKLGCSVKVSSPGKGAKAKLYELRSGRAVKHKSTNPLTQRLNSLGLCFSRYSDKYSEKFIPRNYLINSREIRLELLAGLIDTDGSLKKQGTGCYEITLKVKRLADDVTFLARSLGYYVSTAVKIVNATAYYRMGISGAYDIPVKLDRKRSAPRAAGSMGQYGDRRIVPDSTKSRFAVIPLEYDTYYGFELDGNRHYLFSDFTVTHNSWVSALIMCYRIVMCRLLRNPVSFLGLSRGSPIVFALLSVTTKAVQETIYSDTMNFMAHSAFFTEECKFNIEKKYAALRIPLGNNMMLVAGSQGQHVIGKNTLSVTMDEGNWRREANPDEQAYKLYDEIRHRITGRFQKVAGFMPGICILSSSARDESSFTEQVISDINKVGDERTQRIYRLAGYEVKRHLLQLRPRRFKVAFGLKTLAPRILQGWYREDGSPIDTVLEEPPPGSRTRLVPEDYLPDFKRNITTSLQSICGETTGGAFRLFSDFSIVEMAIDAGDKTGLVNPCTMAQVPLSNDDNKELWDFLDHKTFVQRQLGRFLPKRDPGQPRFAHYDLATVNQAGLSICHVAGRKLVEGLYDSSTGKVFSQYRPVIEYDFILAIVPGEQKEISLIKIQNFLFWLRDRCGYSFGIVTADSYQCIDSNMLVNTNRGLIRMEQVGVGDIVTSLEGPRKVTNKICYKNAPKLKVKTRDGEYIIGTPNHRIWAAKPTSTPRDLSKQQLKYNWYALEDLQVGDVLGMASESVDSVTEVPLPPLPSVLTGSCNPHQPSIWRTPQTITPEFAEVLGLFWGDGHTARPGTRSGNLVTICCHPDDLPDLKVSWEKIGWPARFFRSKQRKCAFVYSASPRLHRWWIECGFCKSPQKGGTPGKEVDIPDSILISPKNVKAAFLRGLFSADGHVDAYGGVMLSTKHLKMAETVQIMLRTGWGISSHITQTKRSFKKGGKVFTGYVLRLRGKGFSKIGFCYSSKQTVFDENLHRPGRNFWSRIESIEPIEPGDVYDIEVEGHPSYTANGIVSHNSKMPLELLAVHGFETELLSMDKAKDPYYSWRSGFSEHLIRMFRHPLLMSEAENLQDLPKKIDHPTPGCFSGDTRIALLDGRNATLRELAAHPEEVWVYAWNGQKIVPARAEKPRCTSVCAPTVIVTLDSGEEITCTPDHRFMLRDGSYGEAKDLLPGTSLMPLRRKVTDASATYDKMVGYEMYYCPGDFKWHYTHRMVGRMINPSYNGSGGLLVHHPRGKLNNDPRVVQVMTKEEHYKLHRDDILRKRKDPVFEANRLKRLLAVIRSPSGRKAASVRMKKLMDKTAADPVLKRQHAQRSSTIGKVTGREAFTRYNKSEAHKKVASVTGKKTIYAAIEATRRSDITIEAIIRAFDDPDKTSCRDVAKHLDCSDSLISHRLRNHPQREELLTRSRIRGTERLRISKTKYRSQVIEALSSKESVKEIAGRVGCSLGLVYFYKRTLNHKVMSVKPGPITDVYDISVPGVENFALTSGVFVHNSKDIADSACGAYFNAVRLGLGSIGVDGAVADLWTERTGQEVKPPIEFKPPEEPPPVHSFEG